MAKHVDGLVRSARLKREATIRRAVAALQTMEDQNRNINFRSVAATARVSTAWLYGQQDLRARIMRLRAPAVHTPSTGSPSPGQRKQSTRNIVETLRTRIRNLEEENRELKVRLEMAYGELASTEGGIGRSKFDGA